MRFVFPLINIAALLLSFFPTNGQHKELSNRSEKEEIRSRAQELFQGALESTVTKRPAVAHKQFDEAKGLWDSIGDNENEALAALQMGDRFTNARKFSEALDYYKLALSLKKIRPIVSSIACDSIGRVYLELQESDLAIRNYKQALNLAVTSGVILQKKRVIGDLADVYYQSGQKEQAVAELEKRRVLNNKLKDDEAEAFSLYLLGKIALDKGQIAKARNYFEESLSIYRTQNSPEGQIKVLLSLSGLGLYAKQNQIALNQAQHASDILDKLWKGLKVGDSAGRTRLRDLRWLARFNLARAKLANGNSDEAVRLSGKAISDSDLMWQLVYSSTDHSSIYFGETRRPVFEMYVDLLMKRRGPKDTNDAYLSVEQSKGISLAALIEARRKMKTKGGNDGLREQNEALSAMRTEILSSNVPAEKLAKLHSEIENAQISLDESRLDAQMNDQQLTWSKPVYVAELQKILRAEKDTDKRSVVEFFLGEQQSYAWLISEDEVITETLPPRQKIENEVNLYLKTISTQPNNLYLESNLIKTKEQGDKLFSTLLGGFGEHILNRKRLTIVPDEILYYLPFEALVHNGHYLIEDHLINYLPSASLMNLLQPPEGKEESDDRMELLAFGDPDFGPLSRGSSGRGSKLKLADVFRGGTNLNRFQLTPLPKTREEVQYISSLFPPGAVRVYLGKESTEDALKRESLLKYKRIHFATHSLIDDVNPDQSAIVLTLDNDPQEDGFLEVSEIMDLKLDCDLVVLSSCQTGRGRLFSGEGIVGLSRAFLYAGARSVVVSLWDVTDISTGQFMETFYKGLKDKVGNAEALRDAKLKMLHSDHEWQHPYYWTPFIIVGNS